MKKTHQNRNTARSKCSRIEQQRRKEICCQTQYEKEKVTPHDGEPGLFTTHVDAKP